MDVITFPDIFPDIFLSFLNFSHNLCLSLFRRGIFLTELAIHMQSKSHISCVYPSTPQSTLTCLTYFNFFCYFKKYASTMLLLRFSLAWFCCLFLQHLKYHTSVFPSHIHIIFSPQIPISICSWQLISYIWFTVNHFCLTPACFITLNLDSIPGTSNTLLSYDC